MDLIVTTERFCKAGETVIGNGFSTAPGGKGANQAVQAARLGADVTLVGKVGNDDFGRNLINSAKASAVNTDYIFTTESAPTAVGNVQIQKTDKGTENRIIVVPGANHKLTLEDVAFLEKKISDFDMVIMQHEIPQEINCKVAGYAKNKGVPVMLNPAPSAQVPEELISCLTFISPNEHEAGEMTGIDITDIESAEMAVKKLVSLGAENVIITLGSKGAVFGNNKEFIFSPSAKGVAAVDPTAAGDSFVAAFCTAICYGMDKQSSMEFANHTASITVTKMGAMPSLPTLDEVKNIMRQRKINVSI